MGPIRVPHAEDFNMNIFKIKVIVKLKIAEIKNSKCMFFKPKIALYNTHCL
jgi:hypothetical protein